MASGRASDSQLREPGFESCFAMRNLGEVWFISLSCMTELLAIENSGYFSQLSHINYSTVKCFHPKLR